MWGVMVAMAAAEPVVHRAVGVIEGYAPNAWWITTDTGVVLIDALFLASDAEALVADIEATGLPLAAVILTHPHVDHFGGLEVVHAAFPDTPILAHAATADAEERVLAAAWSDGWIGVYGDDAPRVAVLPDRRVSSGETLELAGLRFTLTSFGAMEAVDNVVVDCPELGVLFTGDAVLDEAYYLGEGHVDGALQGLAAIGARWPADTRVLPGHGEPGRLGDLIARNTRDVRAFVAMARHPARARRRCEARFEGSSLYGLDPSTWCALNLPALLPATGEGR
ncbi:MAG: MBL fold metallo-hydrolase [Alphaproteobacteria bacterium]|nr:MBL fold metallo-hydrolase [Alphaproteobacteria bacterium]